MEGRSRCPEHRPPNPPIDDDPLASSQRLVDPVHELLEMRSELEFLEEKKEIGGNKSHFSKS